MSRQSRCEGWTIGQRVNKRQGEGRGSGTPPRGAEGPAATQLTATAMRCDLSVLDKYDNQEWSDARVHCTTHGHL